MKKLDNKQGFALLYSILVSSVIVAIGLTMSNIIAKQIYLSSIIKESRIAYYAADSARECMVYWDEREQARTGFTTRGCGNGAPEVGIDAIYEPPSYLGGNWSSRLNRNVRYSVDGRTVCARVIYSDNPTPRRILTIGYNTPLCSASSGRKVEQILYVERGN